MLKQQLTYTADAARFHQAIRHLPWPIWLDSGAIDQQGTDYDILVADPLQRVARYADATEIVDHDGRTTSTDVPLLDVLRQLLGEPTPDTSQLPFSGGAVGYFSYEYGHHLQGLPAAKRANELPQAAVGIYDWAVVVDHRKQQAWLVARQDDSRGTEYWNALAQALEDTDTPLVCEEAALGFLGSLESSSSDADYSRAFERIQRYLLEGDCYQVNLAQRFRVGFEGDPWQLYLHMRKQNPAPYGAFLEFPFGCILSSSPEQFVGLQGGNAISRPIKGTRPRGATPAEDELRISELRDSEKDQAENLMIVDLLRNDLGRVCDPGSIRVPELFKVESYTTVHHLVSSIRGILARGEDALSLLQACFPGGSITGAPKRRAMEIIRELEPVPREVYCGSIGWIGFNGAMNTNIAIRTLLINKRQAYYWAGGGIVADSEERAEYQETLDKAAAFFALVQG